MGKARRALDREGSDDAQRALRADEELREVVRQLKAELQAET